MNLNKTIGRFTLKSLSVHLASMVVFALTLTVLITYQAHIVRYSKVVNSNLLQSFPEGQIVVNNADASLLTSLPSWRGNSPPPVELSALWHEVHLSTELGGLPFAVVVVGEHRNIAHAISIPPSYLSDLCLAVGGSLWLENYGYVNITEVHNEKTVGMRAILYDPDFSQQSPLRARLIIKQGNTLKEALDYLTRFFPKSQLEYAGGQAYVARRVISNIFAPTIWSKLGLAIFVTAAYLTSTLYAFLGKRRPLAILKALGLQSKELAYTIGLEGLVSPSAGILLGFSISAVLVRWLNSRGAGLPLTAGILFSSVLWLLPAIFLGMAIPIKLVTAATVDQLINEKVIAISKRAIKTLRSQYPTLNELITRGVAFVQLEQPSSFNGFIFRKDNDVVKENEIIAYQEMWEGLVTIEYLAPTSGQIIWYQPLTTGIIGVAGKDYDWRYFGEFGPRKGPGSKP